MFYGAHPETFEKAKLLRKYMTKEEKILWNALKANQINGLRFKPQHPIFIFIADFYCHQVKLVIEVDGTSHEKTDQQQYDDQRTLHLVSLGLKVIRFKNSEVKNDLDGVLSSIKNITSELLVGNQSVTPALKGGIDLNRAPNSSFLGVEGKRGGST